MGNSEGINKKVIVVILIIVLGTIMMINIFNKKGNIEDENSIINNNNTNIGTNDMTNDNVIKYDNNLIVENNTIDEDGLIVVTNQFSSVKDNSSNYGLIKVNVNGYKGDTYIPTGNTNNPNINKKPVNVIENQLDKIAPNITVIYSKQDTTNNNIIVRLIFNEQVRNITNGYRLAEDKMSAYKEYKENTSEEVKVYDLAGNEATTKIEIKNIDKVKPQVTKVSDTLFATKKIKTKLTIADNESGINLNGCKYKIDNKEEIEDESNYTKITDLTSLIEKTVANDGIYYLHVISMDNAGNIRKDTIKLIVDSVMPTLHIKYSNTAITNKDVTVTITSNKEMQEVSGWKSNKAKTVFTKTYSKNVDEEVEFTDLVGRKIKAHIRINNIDKVEPVEPKLSQNVFNTRPIDNSKNIDITLTANISDNEGGSGLNLSKCKYVLNQSKDTPSNFNSVATFTKQDQTLHFTIKENSIYYLHIQLVDNAGNERVSTQTIISDTLNPIVTREYNIKEHTNKNVIVTIKANETLKGAEGWEVYDNGKTLRKEFNKNIERTIYTFYDLGGNPVSVDVTISNIDQDKPNDSVINKNTFNTKEFDVVTRISDVGFGLNLEECKYILSSNEKANFDGAATFKNANETLKLKVEKDGVYYLHTFLKDEVGNEKITTHKIIVDSTKPELEISYTNTQITNENVIVTIKANEEIQPVSGWTLSSDKKQLTKTFSANTNINVTVIDIAGNEETARIEINNIDKTNPEVEIKYSTTSQTIDSVTVTIKANEKIQGIEGWILSDYETTLTKVFDENDTQTVTIRDIAGNTITKSIVVANII